MVRDFQGDDSMRNSAMVSRVAFAGFAVWCSSLALGQAKITRPEVSESACPVQVIEVPTQEGRHTTAAVRKPPGKGPFPAAIYLHGTLQPRETKTLVHSLRDQTGSRFLAAGYVTVAATFRSRSNDPLTRDALEDCLAVIAHVKKTPEVDPQSVVLWGDSGGGSLVLELAGETSLCAVTACEPATVLFTGLYSRENLGGKPPYSAGSGMKIMEDPKAYYTPALQKLTREKIAKIACPVFIAHGDRHIINKVNNEVFVPEMKQAGKLTQIILYPGGGHSFSHGGKPDLTQKFFDDCHAFFTKHLPTQPRALETSLLEQVPVNEQPRRAQPPQVNPPAGEAASKTSSARARALFRKSRSGEKLTLAEEQELARARRERRTSGSSKEGK
jgi:acetyl esterase/lipase